MDATTTPLSKKDLRAVLKSQRNAMPQQERVRVDARIAARLAAQPEYTAAPLLLTYLSFGSEVDTYRIIETAWEDGKQVALPRCIPGTRRMQWHAITSFSGLQRSPLGVLEPEPLPQTLVLGEAGEPGPAAAPGFRLEEALAVVPGYTFDERGFRLGYGGGFYDVFLESFPGVSAGLCRSAQISTAIPCLDPHDLPVALVVTETQIIRPEKEGAASA